MSNITWQYVPYTENAATRGMHAVPRFGHSSDFSKLFTGNQEDVTDYVQGLLFIGCFLLAVFVIWFLILLILLCIPDVGFMSGRRFQNATRAMQVRVVFCIAAILSIIFTILLVTKGITNLQDTLTTVDNTNQDVAGIITEADRIATNLQQLGNESQAIRDTLVANLGSYCPGNNDLLVEYDIDLDSQANEAINMLNQLDDFVKGDLQKLKEGIIAAKSVSKDVDNASNTIAIYDWQSLIILIPWILVPSFLLVGLFMAAFNVSHLTYECILRWFFIPLLVIMAIVSISLASVISVAAVSNADFCSGGSSGTPDESVDAIIKNQGFSEGDVLFQAIKYYTGQCRDSGNPLVFIEAFRERIVDANAEVDDLSDSLQRITLDTLEFVCQRDFDEIAGLTEQMSRNLQILKNSTDDTLELLSCDKLVPIYVAAVYDSTCNYSIQGVTWTFSAFLVVAYMGMFMIMFRSAVFGMDYSNDEDKVTYDDGVVEADQEHPEDYRDYRVTSREEQSFESDDDDVYTNNGREEESYEESYDSRGREDTRGYDEYSRSRR